MNLAQGTLLDVHSVALRLGRSARSVETLCRQGRIGWIPGPPIRIREAELWRYLIETRNILPEAFGTVPLSGEAQAALAASRQRVLQDRLDGLRMEIAHRERAAWNAEQRAQSRKAPVKATGAQRPSKPD